jgi:hypothetical protein
MTDVERVVAARNLRGEGSLWAAAVETSWCVDIVSSTRSLLGGTGAARQPIAGESFSGRM